MWRRVLGSAVGALVLSTTFTCSNLDNAIVSRSGQATIPGATLPGELLGDLGFSEFSNFDLSQDQSVGGQGYTKDEIDGVKLVRVHLVVNAPAGGNFDFLDSIALFVEAEGLPRIQIASLTEIPEGVTELELDVEDVQLVDYAVAPAMTLTTEATGTAPEEDTTVTGTIDFDVDINVDGALGC
jgi:hypothetical protein